jgi:endonuclease YncB( thermonuclease family)
LRLNAVNDSANFRRERALTLKGNTMKKLFLTAIILTVCNIATAETITGTVTRVSDGDTLTVKTDKRKTYTIRLARIDAPEISHFGNPAQPFGKEAGDWLREVARGEPVTVQIDTVDKYGRSVGTVFMGNENLNAMMVEDGYAWVFDYFAKDEQGDELRKLETIARENHKGLWIDANPENPADFRKSQK